MPLAAVLSVCLAQSDGVGSKGLHIPPAWTAPRAGSWELSRQVQKDQLPSLSWKEMSSKDRVVSVRSCLQSVWY